MLKVQILKLNKKGQKVFTHLYSAKEDFEDAIKDIILQVQEMLTYTKIFIEFFEIVLDTTIKKNLNKYVKYQVNMYQILKKSLQNKEIITF